MISLFFMALYYFVYMDYIFFVHSSIATHRGWLHFLSAQNSTSINRDIKIYYLIFNYYSFGMHKNVYRYVLLLLFFMLIAYHTTAGFSCPTIILLNSIDFDFHDTNTPLASAQTKTNCPLVCLHVSLFFQIKHFRPCFLVPWHFFNKQQYLS